LFLPSLSTQDETVSGGTDAKSAVPEVRSPHVTFLDVAELGSDGTTLETINFELDLPEVLDADELFQGLEVREPEAIVLEAKEAIGVDIEVTTLVTRLNDLVRGEVGNGDFGFVHEGTIQLFEGPWRKEWTVA
jgi:hypothetical protein